MSDKIPYVFRQNTDFFYLSGCLEPDSVLAITIDSNGSSQSVLFMRYSIQIIFQSTTIINVFSEF